ncbi:MAG: flavin reductase [Pseudomonadota bacterium]
MPGDLRARFLEGMSRAAATVNVVTTDGAAGRAGVTVSAMSSVSADGDGEGGGPTMLVCVHHMSPAAETIIANGCFCANVLADDQSDISDRFAGRIPSETKFDGVDWTAMTTGAPRVVDPLAAFDCRVVSSERVGTHHVFIGEVRDIFTADTGSPLIFANRGYNAAVALGPGPEGREAAGSLSVGALHTFGPDLLPGVLKSLVEEVGWVDLEIYEGDQEKLARQLRAGEIDVAFLYDIQLGRGITSIPVRDLTPYALMAEDHSLAGQDDVSLTELAAQWMVLLESPPSQDYFLSLFDGIAEPKVGYRARTFEMLRGLVANGLGYSILSTKPAADIAYDGKRIVTRPIREPVAPSRLVMAQREGAAQSALTETFLLHCIETFGLDTD